MEGRDERAERAASAFGTVVGVALLARLVAELLGLDTDGVAWWTWRGVLAVVLGALAVVWFAAPFGQRRRAAGGVRPLVTPWVAPAAVAGGLAAVVVVLLP